MPDLHGWITQQIGETERLARDATSGPWAADPDSDGLRRWTIGVVPHNPGVCIAYLPSTYEVAADAAHIALHDPASVLRRCAADRKILAEHKAREGGWYDWYACEGCGYDGADYCSEPMTGHVNDCPTLLALAEGYGLTDEQRAALDRPEKERPKPSPGARLFSNEIMNAYSKALTEMVLNTRPVEPRLMVKLVGPAPIPMPDWLREDLGLPAPAPEPTPEEKAIEILGPELKKTPGYTPTGEQT